MQRDAVRLLSPQHAGLVRKLKQPFIQPLYNLTTRTLVHGRIVIIGDASFTARPHLGVGSTKVTEASIVLAESLYRHSAIPQALQHFNTRQHGINNARLTRSRELGAYLQTQLLSESECRAAQLHRSIDAVVSETACLPS